MTTTPPTAAGASDIMHGARPWVVENRPDMLEAFDEVLIGLESPPSPTQTGEERVDEAEGPTECEQVIADLRRYWPEHVEIMAAARMLEELAPSPEDDATVRVPTEATKAMLKAGMPWFTAWQHMRTGDREGTLAEAYKAMIAAAESGE